MHRPVPTKYLKEIRTLEELIKQSAIEAFQRTGYCLTRGCPSSDYFSCHDDKSTGTLREDRKDRFQECHTIPRAAQLQAIANSNNEAIWVPMRPAEHLTTRPLWSFQSIKRILTFWGFCNSCDNKMFELIDKPLDQVDIERAFLLAYRAFCYKAWRDEVDANSQHLLIEKVKKELDNNASDLIEQQRNYFDSNRLFIKRTNIQIANMFQVGIQNQFFGRLRTVVFSLDKTVPYRYSCAAFMTLDILNRRLPIDWGNCILDPLVFLSVLRTGGHDSLIVSWFDYIPDEISDQFVNSIREVERTGDLADVLVQYANINNHGFAASRDWFNTWSDPIKDQLAKPIIQQIYDGKRPDEIELPTKKWFGNLGFEAESFVGITSPDINKLAVDSLETAKLDLEIEFAPTDLEQKSLPGIGMKLVDDAWNLIEADKFREALVKSAEALRVANRAGVRTEMLILRAEAWRILGESLFGNERPDLAVVAYETAKPMFEELDPTGSNFADLLSRYQNSLSANGQIKQSVRAGIAAVLAHEKLVHENSTDDRVYRLANVLANHMNSLAIVEEFDEALSTGRRCLHHLDGRDKPIFIEPRARVLNNFANWYETNGDLLSAHDAAVEAMELYKRLAAQSPEQFGQECEEFESSLQNLSRKMELQGISKDGVSLHKTKYSNANDRKKAKRKRKKLLEYRKRKK